MATFRELLLEQALNDLTNGNEVAATDALTAVNELDGQTDVVPADATNVVLPPSVDPVGPTISDVEQGELTLQAALDAAAGRDQQNVQNVPTESFTIPGFGTLTRVPGLGGSVLRQFGRDDILGEATGTDGNAQIRNLFDTFNNLLADFDAQREEAAGQLERTRAGEFDDRFSNPAFQNVRIARTPAEAQRIREEGFIPIAARDAELIRQIGLEQANQLRADAEQALAVRQGEGRFARTQQAGLGFGNAIASALTGTNVGQAQNTRLSTLADQARSNILQGVENRRAARAQAGQIDARSRIDEMLANTEAVRELQNLMVQDATNSFRLRFEEERRLEDRINQIADNRQRLEANRPAFVSQLVQLARANQQPGQAQFIQDRSASARGASIRNANQVAVSNAANVAQKAKALVDRAVNSRGLFTNLDEQRADAEIQALLTEVSELQQLTGELEEKGMLAPEVGRIRDQVLTQVQPLISQLGTSGIITEDGVRVESNDRGIGFTKDFGTIGAELQPGINQLVEALGGVTAPPVSLVSGQNNSTLNQSQQVTADDLVSQLQ